MGLLTNMRLYVWYARTFPLRNCTLFTRTHAFAFPKMCRVGAGQISSSALRPFAQLYLLQRFFSICFFFRQPRRPADARDACACVRVRTFFRSENRQKFYEAAIIWCDLAHRGIEKRIITPLIDLCLSLSLGALAHSSHAERWVKYYMCCVRVFWLARSMMMYGVLQVFWKSPVMCFLWRATRVCVICVCCVHLLQI